MRASATVTRRVRTPAASVGRGSLAEIASGLDPERSEFDDWMVWPPDLFFLTSRVLRRTGAYRKGISSDARSRFDQQDSLQRTAQAWLQKLNERLAKGAGRRLNPDTWVKDNSSVRQAMAVCREHWGTTSLERLRTLDERAGADELAQALMTLHALADEAAAGLGLLGPVSPDHALVQCYGNLLLNAKGSLSTLPLGHGFVLPKMRTPQAGLMLRSFSHHLSFHESEVQVHWRGVPWQDVAENTLNILGIPWPQTVQPHWFHPSRETFENVRYFDYMPDGPGARFPIDDVVDLICEVEGEVGRVHVVTLPELALSRDEYELLLGALAVARFEERLRHVPMLVVGVRSPLAGTTDTLNEVRLAAYFAERWYQHYQRKHHRWKLDRNQIRQYRLEGGMSTGRSWYERIPLGQRWLNVLVPNGWLAVCPLICEDLAQLEPVAEVIRGIGPTLLIALLMDGPQLPHRWSARYASVLADDPGTAVLTMTAAGMCGRSQPGDAAPVPPSRMVGLWKDQVKGWQPIELPLERDAFLITVTAEWRQEFTADGRSDYTNAAIFRFEGCRFYECPPLRCDSAEHLDEPLDIPADENGDPAGEEEDLVIADLADIRELTAAVFALDSLLEVDGDGASRIRSWMDGSSAGLAAVPWSKNPIRSMIQHLEIVQRDPASCGVDLGTQVQQWPKASLQSAIDQMIELLEMARASTRTRFNRFKWLTDEARVELGRWSPPAGRRKRVSRSTRVPRAVRLALLMAMHSYIGLLRSRHRIQGINSWDITPAQAEQLFNDIEVLIERHGW